MIDSASNTPEVSICIPCFNAERWVAQAVESACAQEGVACEVLVWDDGSTDASRSILENYAGDIKIEFSENKGGNAARNQLLKNARGNWIQFLDADDFLEPNKIQNDLCAVTAESSAVLSPVKTWYEARQNYGDPIFNPEAPLIEQWLQWHFPQTGGILWNRAFLNKIGGWNELWPNCQDFELTLRAIQAEAQFATHPHAGAVYRIHDNPTVSQINRCDTLENRRRLMAEMVTYLSRENRFSPAMTQVLSEALGGLCRHYASLDLPGSRQFHKLCREIADVKFSSRHAPRSYQFIQRTLGFYAAEWIAAKMRA